MIAGLIKSLLQIIHQKRQISGARFCALKINKIFVGCACEMQNERKRRGMITYDDVCELVWLSELLAKPLINK